MPASDHDILLPFSLPGLCKKKVTVAFDGGQISSDGGVLLLAGADRRLGLIDALAGLIPDGRDPHQISHSMADILRERVFAIACGYPDGNDLDVLRKDPAFKMACGRLPESGDDLASQPTLSRLENAPDLRTLIRISRGMVDFWCNSYKRPPKSIVLDIDDTADTVHGHQQLSLFNAHYDERCFSPIHIYDADTGHCVLTVLRPGKTPSGKEVRAHLRRLVRRIRMHWPETRITIRGDSHYGRREAMDWCEKNGVCISSACPETMYCASGYSRRSTRLASAARWVIWTLSATTPKPVTRRNPGRGNAVSWHGWRRHGKASTSVMSSPTWISARLSGCMIASIVPGDRRKTSLNGTKASWPRTGPAAARRWRTRCA